MIFKDEEFKDLRYNIHEVPENKDLLKTFPKLAQFPEFTERINYVSKNKVIRYTIYCYDLKSPLVKDEKDIFARKELAAKLAGFSRNESTGEWHNTYQDIVDGKNTQVNYLITRYLIHQNHMKFTQYVTLCETYYVLSLNIRNNTISNEKNPSAAFDVKRKGIEALSKLADSIDNAYDDIFLRDRTLIAEVEDVASEALGKVITGYPELIASQKRDKGD